jgi:hypothetical protein
VQTTKGTGAHKKRTTKNGPVLLMGNGVRAERIHHRF